MNEQMWVDFNYFWDLSNSDFHVGGEKKSFWTKLIGFQNENETKQNDLRSGKTNWKGKAEQYSWPPH